MVGSLLFPLWDGLFSGMFAVKLSGSVTGSSLSPPGGPGCSAYPSCVALGFDSGECCTPGRAHACCGEGPTACEVRWGFP